MDVSTAVHAVAAISATSRELVELWRRLTGSGSTVTLSGHIIAIGWMSGAQERVRATQRAGAKDLGWLMRSMHNHPDCRFMLVQIGKRVKVVALQRREDLAAGKLIMPSGPDSPLVVTCTCGCAPSQTLARSAAR